MDGVFHTISRLASEPHSVAAHAPAREYHGADLRPVPKRLLDIVALTKRYRDQVALAGVGFAAGAGEVVGIIGPNGAGKTTLLETIAGVLPAEAGEVIWRGAPLPQARRREAIFYLPDGIRPYDQQPASRVLEFFAGVYRQPDAAVANVIAALGLAPVLSKRVQALSKGYARRLMLGLGLLAPHPVLLMDEPFDGFDLRQTRSIAQMLRRVASEGRTLVLAIHQLADAERVCDRFVLLADGRVRGSGTLAELRARVALPDASLEDIFLALT
jgi:ABC-type multidrug transport system ATPase subunit